MTGPRFLPEVLPLPPPKPPADAIQEDTKYADALRSIAEYGIGIQIKFLELVDSTSGLYFVRTEIQSPGIPTPTSPQRSTLPIGCQKRVARLAARRSEMAARC